MWENVVYEYSEQYNKQFIEQCINQAKAITMHKIIRCIVEEQLYLAEQIAQGYTLFLHHSKVTYDRHKQAIQIDGTMTTNPLSFLRYCAHHSNDDYHFSRFIAEIKNHLIHQALSFIHCSGVPKSNHPILGGDQWVITGHNIHPCAKTKLGMPIHEVMLYAPEYNKPFELNWILVRKALLYNNLSAEHLEALLLMSGYPMEIPDEYYLIPVHPYQYAYELPGIYQQEILNEDIIMLDHRGGKVKSTSSFRTVCPLDDNYPIIKLPINAQMTSTVRSISNNSVMNSKHISDYIESIYRQDAMLNAISTPLSEYGGMTYCHHDELKQRNLSFILRENNTASLRNEERLYTATCLLEKDEHGQKIYLQLINESNKSALEWFEAYTELLISTTLQLMTKYGIGLEAHMQNISVRFNQGYPVHIYIKDYGGLRVDSTRTHSTLQLHEGHTKASEHEMHEKVQNTLISNHISTLITHLSEDKLLEEGTLWQIVSRQIAQTFEVLSKAQYPWLNSDYQVFTQGILKQKALMTMRLSKDTQDIYIEKVNPLYEQFNQQQ